MKRKQFITQHAEEANANASFYEQHGSIFAEYCSICGKEYEEHPFNRANASKPLCPDGSGNVFTEKVRVK